MFLLKELSVLFAILFLAATGLLEISNSFLVSKYQNNQQKTEQNVNDYSVDLGDKGRAAVKRLFEEAEKRKVIVYSSEKIFI